MIDNGQAFAKVKGSGPDIGTMQAFLGKQWSRYLIENSLSVIRQEEVAVRKKADAYEAAQRAKEEKERRQAASPMGRSAQFGAVALPGNHHKIVGVAVHANRPNFRPVEAVLSKHTLPWTWLAPRFRQVLRPPGEKVRNRTVRTPARQRA